MEESPSGGSDYTSYVDRSSYGQSGRVVEPSSFIKSEIDTTAPPVVRHHSQQPPQPVPGTPVSPPAPSFTPSDPPPSIVSPVPEGRSIEVDPDHPLAVTEVYSTYGIEYILLFFSLAAAAIGLGSLLNAVVSLATNNSASIVGSLFNPYAEATLIVSFPIFAFLFLRLEGKEEADPSLVTDASRRRSMQIVLVISFVVALSGLIGYIGSLLGSSLTSVYTSSSGSSGLADFLHALIDLLLGGGIFAYYWYKLHKKTGLN